jgi:hypothetical protein
MPEVNVNQTTYIIFWKVEFYYNTLILVMKKLSNIIPHRNLTNNQAIIMIKTILILEFDNFLPENSVTIMQLPKHIARYSLCNMKISSLRLKIKRVFILWMKNSKLVLTRECFIFVWFLKKFTFLFLIHIFFNFLYFLHFLHFLHFFNLLYFLLYFNLDFRDRNIVV